MLLLELKGPIAFLAKLTVGHRVTYFPGVYIAGRFITFSPTASNSNKQTNKQTYATYEAPQFAVYSCLHLLLCYVQNEIIYNCVQSDIVMPLA